MLGGIIMRIASILFLITIQSACTDANLVQIWMWEDGTVSQAELESGMYDIGPCGVTRLVAAGNFARFSEDELEHFDQVLEFDAAGDIVRRWHTPANSFILDLMGDVLHVSNGSGAVEVHANGSLVEANRTTTAPAFDGQVECPDSLRSEYPRSDFLQCWRFVDTSEANPRLLAFEGTCT